MDAFYEYKQAHEDMAADENVAYLRQRVANAERVLAQEREALAMAQRPYIERVVKADAWIRGAVLEAQRTTVLHGVAATYHKGRRTVEWRTVAEAAGASKELIDRHAKEGEPYVTIKLISEGEAA